MTDAREKNLAALAKLLGNSALADRLGECRLAVVSDDRSDTISGRLLAEALGDTLGRLWQQIDSQGPLAGKFLEAASHAAESAGYQSTLRDQFSPPYDYVIVLGDANLDCECPTLRLGASGWRVSAGRNAFFNDDPNPVGPTLAAGLGGAEAFKTLFADALGDKRGEGLGDLIWSAWSHDEDGAQSAKQGTPKLDFEDLFIFGIGAVTHGLAWILERWPAPITGSIHLVDADHYDQSNGQRYAGYHSEHHNEAKSVIVADRLHKKHLGANFIPYECDMNAFVDRHRPECKIPLAIAGLDSKESRRQLALKLPRRTINMWTDGSWLGAARFGFDGRFPCLYCAYPEAKQAELDETGEIYQMTGLLPARVRYLLDSGEPLTTDDAQRVSQKIGGSTVAEFVGRPLRSVQGHICATGKAVIGPNAEEADVPFAFVSLLAGVFGFVELVKELQQEGKPARWVYNSMSPPRIGCLEPTGPRPDCYLCGDETTKSVVA